jgi:hypothetical protein
MSRARRTRTAVALLVMLVATAGCSADQERPVRAVADEFYAALTDGRGAVACSSLAPRTVQELEQSAGAPCAEAVLDEELPPVGAPVESHVFGRMAQLRYRGETTFLARFADGWKVMAVGCTHRSPGSYDCKVKGG